MRISRFAMGAALAICAGGVLAHGEAQPGRPMSTGEKAFGREGDPAKATRTIAVSMSDRMRFTPSTLTVRKGETVRFRVTNRGRAMHEMVLGTEADLREHAELMKKNPGMEHDEAYMAHVAPGKTGTMVWQFTQAGEFRFGCLVPGHFDAGMQGRITVVER